MLSLLPAERAAALAGGPVTIDLDTTDVEVYGRKKRGVAYSHQGQRVGRPHVAAWAETETVLAADLAMAPITRGRPRRACCAAPWAACRRRRGPGGWPCAPTPGSSPGSSPGPPHGEHVSFAIGAERIAPLPLPLRCPRRCRGLRFKSWKQQRFHARLHTRAAAMVPGSRCTAIRYGRETIGIVTLPALDVGAPEYFWQKVARPRSSSPTWGT
jgi:hypothetical protein